MNHTYNNILQCMISLAFLTYAVIEAINENNNKWL